MREDLAKIVNELSLAERQELETYLAFKKVKNRAGVSDFTETEQLVIGQLKKIFVVYPGGVTQAIDKHLGRAAFSEAVAQLVALLENGVLVKPKRVELDKYIFMCLDCLSQLLRYWDVVLTPKSMLSMIHQVPAALDFCFPGYYKAKHLHMLLRLQE